VTIFTRPIVSHPEPDEDGPELRLGDVEVDTEKETITLRTVDGQILYTSSWEAWGLQQLVAGG
jgi:hypothetical protein